MQLGNLSNSESVGSGSGTVTSSPTEPNLPSFNARISPGCSTIPPRAVLTNTCGKESNHVSKCRLRFFLSYWIRDTFAIFHTTELFILENAS